MDALRIPPNCPWLLREKNGNALMACFPENDGRWTVVSDDYNAFVSEIRSRHIRDTVAAMGETYWRIHAEWLSDHSDVMVGSGCTEEELSKQFQHYRDAVEQAKLWRAFGDSARQ